MRRCLLWASVVLLAAGCGAADPEPPDAGDGTRSGAATGDTSPDGATEPPTAGTGAGAERDAASLTDANGGAAGSDADATTELGEGCIENPDLTDLGCRQICPEQCNDADDDCDGTIDEGRANDACAFDNAVADCDHGQCVMASCHTGFRDCDGDADNGCETTDDDVDNCGSCGNRCDLPNAIAACQGGQCVAIGCQPLFDDCDDNVIDCETTTTSLGNCGGCGLPCSDADIAHGSASCARGFCGVGECEPDYGDCNLAPGDGCEQALNTSEHCGMCDTGCDLPGSSHDDCSSGTCLSGDCDESGYAQCDGNAVNGCEPLDTADNCGGCGQTCDATLPNTRAASCEQEGCALECQNGFGDCDDQTATGCEARLDTLARCGSCTSGCALPHAVVSCQTGSCRFVRCETGWDDCNDDTGDPETSDGCETSLNADTTCGSCGNDCTVTTLPSCSGGSCSEAVCDPGSADCDPGGQLCEVDLETDPDNCGRCDFVCRFDAGVAPHADAALACVDGTCVADCDPGFDDCNGDYSDGCETPLDTLTNCGSCGTACAIPHATESCQSGSCSVVSCDSDWGDCDADPKTCETQLNTTADCGACDRVCSLTHATAICGGSAGDRGCALGACSATHYKNCDGIDSTGCEIDTRNNPAHCGACNFDCRSKAFVDGASCVSSSCEFTCEALHDDCNNVDDDGCETPLTTLTDCGECGIGCSRPHGVVSCATGTCTLTGCDAGYEECDGVTDNGCEPLTTLTDCGACADPCLPPHADGDCSTQQCAIAQCATGWADCDGMVDNGCERDTATLGPCLPDAGCVKTPGPDGRDYFFCPGPRTWSDARARCALQFMGDLVRIDDAAENAFVHSLLATNAWIGAVDDEANSSEGNWRWINDGVLFWMGAANGSAVGGLYTHWNSGEPNDYNGDEDCAEMRADGVWNDLSCSQQYAFVCEVQPDLCPSSAKNSPGQCGCEVPDDDADGDNTADCIDGCPNDPNKVAPGACLCGTADTDSDGDGTPNCKDGCPNDPNKVAPGACLCGTADTDSDGDGTPDCNDECPFNATTTVAPCSFPFTTSNFDPLPIPFASAPASVLDCADTITVDTSSPVTVDNWCGTPPTPVVQSQAQGPDVVILPLRALTLAQNRTLLVRGDRPLVIAVLGDATIAGRIDASAAGPTPGPGGDVSCGNGTGSSGQNDGGNNDGAGGGGGGAYGQNGGRGGNGLPTLFIGGASGGNRGTAEGNAQLVPLRGGCRGGNGGNGAGGGGGQAGAGGGALQLSVSGSLSLTASAVMTVSGGGGLPSGTEDGGGGGGSGGALLLEAGSLTLQSGAWLTANGGGGASGNPTNNTPGNPGTDGYAALGTRAPGGPSVDASGGGGGGGAQNGGAQDGSGGGYLGLTAGAGGGGGGGGVGRIRLRGDNACTLGANTSPAAGTTCP